MPDTAEIALNKANEAFSMVAMLKQRFDTHEIISTQRYDESRRAHERLSDQMTKFGDSMVTMGTDIRKDISNSKEETNKKVGSIQIMMIIFAGSVAAIFLTAIVAYVLHH